MNNNKKNIFATLGLISVVVILIIIIMVSGGQEEASINENNDNNIVQNENMSSQELFNEIESQPGYEEDEQATIGTDLEDSETQYSEESSQDEESSNATVNPEQLPNPDFNNDDSEQENQYQGERVTFQAKRYMIQTNSKKEIKIRLKGTPKAKVKGVYKFLDKKGNLETKQWDKTLNREGEDTVKIRITHKPDKVEFQILSIELEDGSNMGECIVENYELK